MRMTSSHLIVGGSVEGGRTVQIHPETPVYPESVAQALNALVQVLVQEHYGEVELPQPQNGVSQNVRVIVPHQIVRPVRQ